MNFKPSFQRIYLGGELAQVRENVRQLRSMLLCAACDLFEGRVEMLLWSYAGIDLVAIFFH